MTIGKAPELIAIEAQSLEPFSFSIQSTVLSELKRLIDSHLIRLVMTQAAYQETLNGLRNKLWQTFPDGASELERVDQFQNLLEQLSVSILSADSRLPMQPAADYYEQLAQVLTDETYKTRQRMYVISPKQGWKTACESRNALYHLENLEVLLERFIAESYMQLSKSSFVDHEEALIDNYLKDDVLLAFGGPEAWTEVCDLLENCTISIENNDPAVPHFKHFRIATLEPWNETILKATPKTHNQLTTVFSVPLAVFLILTPGEGALTYIDSPFEDDMQMDPAEWQAACIVPTEIEAVLTEDLHFTDDDDEYPVRYKLASVRVDPCGVFKAVSLSPEKSEFGDYVNNDQGVPDS